MTDVSAETVGVAVGGRGGVGIDVGDVGTGEGTSEDVRGFLPYSLSAGVVSCTENTISTIHPIIGINARSCHQPLLFVSWRRRVVIAIPGISKARSKMIERLPTKGRQYRRKNYINKRIKPKGLTHNATVEICVVITNRVNKPMHTHEKLFFK